jgi:membrane associated rhomboid family serine protease
VLGNLLAMDKVALAHGEIWRLWTVTLVHAPLTQNPLHLLFNMYALWLSGPVVERMYGRWRLLLFYLVFAAGGSLFTFAVSTGVDSRYGVGASGAIFGLFGLLFAAERIHRPVLDGQSRALLGQMGGLLVINLIFGFVVPGIDNMAHVGGMIAGLWFGFLFAPTSVPTRRSPWGRRGAMPATVHAGMSDGGSALIRLAGALALLGFFAVLFVMGLGAWG